MKRFQAVIGWFFMCFGLALLGLSVLIVPGTAFAQDSSCQDTCCNVWYFGTTCDTSDPNVLACTTCCNGCMGDLACITNCQSPKDCVGGDTCDTNGKCANQWDLYMVCDGTHPPCDNGTDCTYCYCGQLSKNCKCRSKAK